MTTKTTTKIEPLAKPKKISNFEKLQNLAVTNVNKTLLSTLADDASQYVPEQSTESKHSLSINVDLIDVNPFQPRILFVDEEIAKLAESIKTTGQIEPIVVRMRGDRYELIAGERRLRAFKLLNLDLIEAVVKDATDSMMAVMALAENIHRVDLSDYEVGISISNIAHLFTSTAELIEYIGKSQGDVYRYLAYSELPKWVRDRLEVNPRLFNRTNALALKGVFALKEYDDKIYRPVIIKAMKMLEANALTQTLFISHIKRLVKSVISLHHNPNIVDTVDFSLDGKNVGKLHYDSKKLSIKISSKALTESDVKEIEEFIKLKISGKD